MPATFTLADKNDAATVFAFAAHLGENLDNYDRRRVADLRECVIAQRVHPEDTGSHPYDGAALDTFWALFDTYSSSLDLYDLGGLASVRCDF